MTDESASARAVRQPEPGTSEPGASEPSRSLDLHLELDPRGGRRAAVEDALRSAIRSGRLRHGDPVPSTRSLAGDLGLSRATVVAAYEQLTAEGYLHTQQGARTTVAYQSATGRQHHDTITGTAASTTTGTNSGAGGGRGDVGPANSDDEPTIYVDLDIDSGRDPVADPGVADPLSVRLPANFHPGHPDVSAFPRRRWLSCARVAVQRAVDTDFDYPHLQGHRSIREQVASYLGRVRGMVVGSGDVVICAGFLSALTGIAQCLARQGTLRIGVEDPMLFIHRLLLQSLGIELVPIDVDRDGLRIDMLADLDQPVDAVLVTPAHQYPLGATMSAERRMALIEWARDRGAWIIEDDYDAEFRYDGRPVSAIQGVAPDRVIHVGTTSKTLAPGLRLGWITVPPELREPIAWSMARHGGVSALEQLTMAEFIASGAYDRHIRGMRRRYRQRRQHLVDQIEQVSGLTPMPASAGLSICVLLDRIDLDAPQVERIANQPATTDREIEADLADEGVGVVALSHHYADRSRACNGLVIGFAAPSQHQFPTAVDALSAGLRNHLG